MRDYALETTFDVKFTTRRFSTGAPFTLAGTPVISAYPGNSTTQLTAGITLTVDFDGVTGLHNIRVVATAANGYAANTNYALVITTGTVDSVSVVGETVAEFSLEAQSPLRPSVDGRELVVESDGMGHADVREWLGTAPAAYSTTRGTSGTALPAAAADAAGGLIISDAGGLDADAQLVTKINDILTDTGTTLDGKIDAIDTVVDAILVDTGTTLQGELDGIQADTEDIQTRLPAALVGGRMDSNASAISGDSVAADNAEAFFDGTGYAGTNNVIPVVTSTDAIGTAGISATSFAAGAIDAAAIAAAAIGASELADGAITAAKIATGAIDADALAADAVDEIFDETIGDSTITVRQALRVMIAALAGKLSGAATTTVTIRNVADDTDRITATVDADGNRTAVTLSV